MMSKTIIIYAQIFDDNLGDGWKNNYEAALALANYTEETWRNELKDLEEKLDLDITIDIEVQKNTIGISRDCQVDCDDYELQKEVELTITDEKMIWDQFCRTIIAEELYRKGE